MLIKVIIRRHFQDNKMKEARYLLKTLRMEAMNQAGYMSGETLYNQYDPKSIITMSIWQNAED